MTLPRTRLSRLFAALGALAVTAVTFAATESPLSVLIPATDERITYSDGLEVVRDASDGSVHFDRQLDTPNRGFRWDAPGARVRWRTDSPVVRARLRYTARHIGTSRQSTGFFRVDGVSEGKFERPRDGTTELTVNLPTPGDGRMHDYELILPYGDSLDILGVEVATAACWNTPAPRPAVRYLAFGDSVTHGFTASTILATYAFRLAEARDWELINLGIGGRGTHGDDGHFLSSIPADVITLLIGVNDWQAGRDLASFRTHYRQLLDHTRRGQPRARLIVITPLWVPPTWQPSAARQPLEAYRRIIREVAAEHEDPTLTVIDGPSLIDHDPALFDAVAVHPNDAGFAQMAERLARRLQLAP